MALRAASLDLYECYLHPDRVKVAHPNEVVHCDYGIFENSKCR